MYKYLFFLISFVLLFSCKVNKSIEETSAKDTFNKKVEKETEDTTYKEWIKFKITDLGHIYIPPDMEVQKGEYKKLQDKIYEIAGIDYSGIVFQQKGLNKMEPESFKTYARVIITTEIDEPGAYDKITTPIILTESELLELNDEFEKGFKKMAEEDNMKITKWYPLEIYTSNDMHAILVQYDRQLGNNPEVFFQLFQFQNYDRLHRLTLSYRIEDEEKWKPIFENVLKGFKITNIRGG